MQGKSGNLPGECATLVGDRVCAPRVEVDGTRLSDLAVLQGVVGIVGNPEGRRVSLNSLRARRAGIALAVFHQLVAVEARRDHVTVTRSQARALAEKELGFYERTPPTERGQIYFNVIPAGSSPRAYFLSSRMIALYRHGMVIGTERDIDPAPLLLASRRHCLSSLVRKPSPALHDHDQRVSPDVLPACCLTGRSMIGATFSTIQQRPDVLSQQRWPPAGGGPALGPAPTGSMSMVATLTPHNRAAVGMQNLAGHVGQVDIGSQEDIAWRQLSELPGTLERNILAKLLYVLRIKSGRDERRLVLQRQLLMVDRRIGVQHGKDAVPDADGAPVLVAGVDGVP